MGKHQCIMVVDDEQAILSLLTRTLEPEGYGVIVADNGESALALLDEHKPDLVILDVVMPGLDGFQVLDMIRQRYSIPVIMLISEDEVTCLHNTLAAGADDYVTKPLSMPELMARVRVKLRRSGVGTKCKM